MTVEVLYFLRIYQFVTMTVEVLYFLRIYQFVTTIVEVLYFLMIYRDDDRRNFIFLKDLPWRRP
jgi:hypothetical protein